MFAVRAPAEATVDSELLVKASMQSTKMARAMKSGSGAFDIDEFLSRLVTFMGGRANVGDLADDDDDTSYDDDEGDGSFLQWERIGWKVVAKSHRVPAMDFMSVTRTLSLYHTHRSSLGWDHYPLNRRRVPP